MLSVILPVPVINVVAPVHANGEPSVKLISPVPSDRPIVITAVGLETFKFWKVARVIFNPPRVLPNPIEALAVLG